MTQPALRQIPGLPPEAAYVDHVSESLSRALRSAVATLPEPRVAAPERALHVLGKLVESITGFALGAIGGQLATGTRRWFGDEAAREVLAALRGHLRPVTPRWGVARTRYLADADARPLVDELGARLHLQFAHVPIAAMVDSTHATLARLAPQRLASLPIALELLAREDHLAERLRAELIAGWAQYAAALAGARSPTTSPLWTAWSRAVRGEPEPTPAPHPGYIVLVH